MSRATDSWGNLNRCQWAVIEIGACTASGLNEILAQAETQMAANDIARVLRLQIARDGEGRYQIVPLSLLRKEGLVS